MLISSSTTRSRIWAGLYSVCVVVTPYPPLSSCKIDQHRDRRHAKFISHHRHGTVPQPEQRAYGDDKGDGIYQCKAANLAQIHAFPLECKPTIPKKTIAKSTQIRNHLCPPGCPVHPMFQYPKNS